MARGGPDLCDTCTALKIDMNSNAIDIAINDIESSLNKHLNESLS